MTRPEIERLIERCVHGAELPREWTPAEVSPALIRFKHSWEDFVDGVMKEWKTMNLVSALLLSYVFLLLLCSMNGLECFL